ncbi:hypothetical protein A0H81_05419 [Grifola frondosa]|uniref:AMP-binding enzyme C-terminal domain-containing protein n=1 Tax=Grifola frondosa TaxID=5627 RepID=A0A1C7MIZ2_GRIFR|nr:hypothetical protein A0H81_05419 [Grifola frondosa]
MKTADINAENLPSSDTSIVHIPAEFAILSRMPSELHGSSAPTLHAIKCTFKSIPSKAHRQSRYSGHPSIYTSSAQIILRSASQGPIDIPKQWSRAICVHHSCRPLSDIVNAELWGFVTSESVMAAASLVQPYYAVPMCFIAMDEFPHRSNGKIDKRALRQMALDKIDAENLVAQRSMLSTKAEFYSPTMYNGN